MRNAFFTPSNAQTVLKNSDASVSSGSDSDVDDETNDDRNSSNIDDDAMKWGGGGGVSASDLNDFFDYLIY